MSDVFLSKEFIKEEILKCAESVTYFLETYGRIRDEKLGMIPLVLYDYQKEILEEIEKNKYLAILKSRQIGISTVVAGFIAWYILFRKQRHIFIMATKREKASISFEMVKMFIKECPDWLKLYKVVKNNTFRFELSNGSWIKCQATALDAGVGEAASLFFIDEAALIDKLREHWVGMFPTISTGGRCVIASTPRGAGNKFWEICKDGSKKVDGKWSYGINEFKILNYPWFRRFSKEWYDKEIIGKSEREIAQEYECKFLESGNTFLDGNSFDIVKSSICNPIETSETGNLWIWKKPIPLVKYLIGADVAKGDSVDFSACHVLDLNNCDIVAEYKAKIKTNEFAHFLVDLAKKYNKALIVPESNSLGDSVITHILESGYDNLYFSHKGVYIHHYDAMGKKAPKPGFFTSLTTRAAMLQILEEYIRVKKVSVHSQRLYDEFTTFVWKGEKPESIRGTNDDLVISLAICLYVKDKVFKTLEKREQGVEALASGFISSRSKFDVGNKNNSISEAENLSLLISRH